MLVLCPAQGLRLVLSQVALAEARAVTFGEAENGEGAGRRSAFLLFLIFE